MVGLGLLLCSHWALLLCSCVQAYENLARNKEAWQSNHDDSYHNGAAWVYLGADRAVDGRKQNISLEEGECASSVDGQTAEWRVDLGKILSIHHIFLQHQTGNNVWDGDNWINMSFLGFSVYISNTKNKDDGVLCFRDTNYTRSTIPNPVIISCPFHGRYVIYYNNRTHKPFPDGYYDYVRTGLCEVEVYGCPTPGYFGESCSIPCPQNCLERRCHITEGSCVGCSARYRGLMCNDKCNEWMFGKHCNQSCGKCLNNEQCQHISGSCLNGCDSGYVGIKCSEECSVGLFGRNCAEFCSLQCKTPGVCDKVTGQCKDGCQAGWTQRKCDSEFPGGFYGYDCQESCSTNCIISGTCDRVTGQCEGGCQAGWTGFKCDKVCSDGTFGQGCTEECGECLGKEQCHHIDGTCANGCNPGYYGITCTEDGNSDQDILRHQL